MRLDVDASSGVPPFEQVREGIRAQVESGQLEPGFRLPPVRALADSLGLAANTVARAYKELEALGVVEPVGGPGRSSPVAGCRGRCAPPRRRPTGRASGRRRRTTTRWMPYAARWGSEAAPPHQRGVASRT